MGLVMGLGGTLTSLKIIARYLKSSIFNIVGCVSGRRGSIRALKHTKMTARPLGSLWNTSRGLKPQNLIKND